ncbi:MAG TPA: MFS transporter [Treponemataceae bacterium]|nr:MFS transporter [Treponemataceae bacterium]
MKFDKTEKSWITYDVANSAYATIMMAAIFPIFFTGICSEATGRGDFWWGIGTSIATAIIAILAPMIGAIADIHGYKKRIFSIFLVFGITFSLAAVFSPYWELMLIGYILSRIGFTGGNLTYDSFLTDATTIERMDTVSSWAFGLGYIGGSTVPFLMSIALIMFGQNIGIDGVMAVKISVVIMAIWWALFSIPFLRNVKQKHGIDKPKKDLIKNAFVRIIRTAKSIFTNKAMMIFILAYFFYIDGVGTTISMSTSYGAELNLNSTSMILALLVTQIVAFPCAILFGRLSRKVGSITMITVGVCIYLVVCVVGFVMGFGLEENFLSIQEATSLFWVLAVLVGTSQGGIQAISRSYYAKLIPPESSGEYFGFFDIFGKFAAVVGPALYALLVGIFGRSSFGIFALVFLFLTGFLILIIGRKTLIEAEREKAEK